MLKPSEPFHLSSSQLTGRDLDLLDGIVERHLPLKLVDQLAISGGFDGGLGKRVEPLEQISSFVNPAGIDHRFDARIDSAIQFIAVPVQTKPPGGVSRLAGRPFGLKRRNRLASQFIHFQRTHESSAIVDMNALGGGGVDALQSGVQFGQRRRAKPQAKIGVRAGSFKQSFKQRFVIKRRAACRDQRNISPDGIRNNLIGLLDKLRDRKCFVRIDHVDQVMNDLLSLGGAWLGGADVHVPVNLHRIDAENLRPDFLRHTHRQIRFSRCGGPQNDNDVGLICHVGKGCQNCSVNLRAT